jgi:hypothetical protein
MLQARFRPIETRRQIRPDVSDFAFPVRFASCRLCVREQAMAMENAQKGHKQLLARDPQMEGAGTGFPEPPRRPPPHADNRS